MAHIDMLAWVDTNTHLVTRQCLSNLGMTLNIFSDLDTFIDDITQETMKPDSVILITSSLFGQQLLHVIDSLPQLCTVYIYSSDANKHVSWAQQCNKLGVDRIFTDANHLIQRIILDLENTKLPECVEDNVFNRIFISEKQNTSTISLFSGVNYSKSTRDLTEEKVTFIWLQLLNTILLEMPQLPTAREEMLSECERECANDQQQLKYIKEFRETYEPVHALNWYTRETFLFQLLNKALRTENIDIIFKFRIIIIDLYRQLTQLFQSPDNESPTLNVYRGQRMNLSEIEKLHTNINGLISMNSFVSTTRDEKQAKKFSSEKKHGQVEEETVAVLFKLNLDVKIARETNKPFADIHNLSRYSTEQEVLLCMGTVFRIDAVDKQSSGTWYITATMCTCFDDSQITQIFNNTKEEMCSNGRITYSTYGKFLALMSNFDSAISYLTKLLPDQQSIPLLKLTDAELATIHNDLAYAYRDSFQYSKALEHYQKALDIKSNRIPLDEIDLAVTYSDMGWLLINTKQLKKARDFHEKALTIRMKDFENHRSDVAMSLNCLGLVCTYMEEFDLAIKYLTESLEIREKHLSPEHPYTGMSYSSLGSYYESINNNAKALQMYEKALSIYKSSVPPTHQILVSSYRDISRMCLEQRQWQKAIEYSNAALNGRFTVDDRTRAVFLTDLGQAYTGVEDYECAYTSYQEALKIARHVENNKLVEKLMKMIKLVKNRQS